MNAMTMIGFNRLLILAKTQIFFNNSTDCLIRQINYVLLPKQISLNSGFDGLRNSYSSRMTESLAIFNIPSFFTRFNGPIGEHAANV